MLYSILAVSPLLLIILLLLGFKKPLVFAAPLTLLYTLFLVFGVWHMQPAYMQGALVKGVLVAADIALIIFGAVFFLQFLKRTGVIDNIETYLCSLSPDHRIQVILLAWFFLSFIEGMSGFGTPMAIVAPLLVGLGFPAVLAVTLALVGVGTSVAFGAVGTPIRVGLAGLPTAHVAFYAALMNLIAGIVIPLFLVFILVRARAKQQKGALTEILPFALWSGVCLTVPYFLASFLGKEFPSLIGPFVGAILLIMTIKHGWFVPKTVWRLTPLRRAKRTTLAVGRIIVPYLVFVICLLLGKCYFGSYTVTLAPELTHTISFFNPIIAFVIGALVFTVIYHVDTSVVRAASVEATRSLRKPLLVIFCISAFVQLMISSGYNTIDLPSMLVLMTGWLVTPLLPLFAPFIGVFGAFISGSATVSNLLFANVQFKAAQTLGINDQVILAQQTVGGGIGNTVSLTDITVVEATVQLHGEENHILRAVFWPVVTYALVIGVIGFTLIYFL